jgi:NTE family protein
VGSSPITSTQEHAGQALNGRRRVPLKQPRSRVDRANGMPLIGRSFASIGVHGPLSTDELGSFAVSPPVRVSLALGGGGARGYAHIGAIQVLEERGVEIVNIAGSSMGALVGALYAAGQLDEYTEWIESLTQLEVLRLLDLSLNEPGMIRAEKVFARMHDLLGDARIEDLRVPYTAVATDLFARKAVWFQEGPVQTAVRASIAIPGVFTPLILNGRVLVDGGLMDPVPVAPTASSRADMTIAIDLGGERAQSRPAVAERETAEHRPVDEWIERFRRGAANLFERDRVRSWHGASRGSSSGDHDADEASPGEAAPAGLRGFDVMIQSLEAMQSLLTRFRLAGNPPDLLITVPKDACRTMDFHRGPEMIALGRELTIATLDGEAPP